MSPQGASVNSLLSQKSLPGLDKDIGEGGRWVSGAHLLARSLCPGLGWLRAMVKSVAPKVNTWIQMPTLVHSTDFIPLHLSFSVCPVKITLPILRAVVIQST